MLRALRKVDRLPEAIDMLDSMSLPDAESFTTVLKGCTKDDHVTSLRLVNEMKERSLKLDGVAYSCSLRSHMRAGMWEEGMKLFDEMQRTPDVTITPSDTMCALRGLT